MSNNIETDTAENAFTFCNIANQLFVDANINTIGDADKYDIQNILTELHRLRDCIKNINYTNIVIQKQDLLHVENRIHNLQIIYKNFK